jgi:hypothetical protein
MQSITDSAVIMQSITRPACSSVIRCGEVLP